MVENFDEKPVEESKAVVAVAEAKAGDCGCGCCNDKTHPAGAIILGILSLFCSLSVCSLQLAGIIMGIIGIALGSKAKKGTKNPDLGKAGLTLSVLGLIFNVLSVVIWLVLGVAAYVAIEAMMPQIQYYINGMRFMF